EAENLVAAALGMQEAGAAALLLEAVPPEVSARVVNDSSIPVIGCGAGAACHGHVIVTHDGLGLSGRRPRFVPTLGDLSSAFKEAFSKYVRLIQSGEY